MTDWRRSRCKGARQLIQYRACPMLSCHLVFCLGSVQMCISSLQPPNPVICQPCNEHSNEGKGESVGGSSCPMAVGATALAVEGQQPHHQHPQIGQLTPPLYKAVQLLCLEIQRLMQAVGSWGYTPLPLLWKASRPTMCNPKDGTAHVVPPNRRSIWNR